MSKIKIKFANSKLLSRAKNKRKAASVNRNIEYLLNIKKDIFGYFWQRDLLNANDRIPK